MDRNRQNITAMIEDALRAVAVMHIDIKDRRTPPGAQQGLRGNRGIVEKAETAGKIAERMVTGRAAQGIGSRFACQYGIHRSQRRLRRPVSRLPGAGRNRAGCIGLVKPDCPVADLG
jgi:hypothetical protein